MIKYIRCGAVAAAALGAITPARAQQHEQQPLSRPPSQKKQIITLPSLAAQGFEVKASFGSYLVLQRDKDVWLCYMLQTRSTCEAAE